MASMICRGAGGASIPCAAIAAVNASRAGNARSVRAKASSSTAVSGMTRLKSAIVSAPRPVAERSSTASESSEKEPPSAVTLMSDMS